jgi:hypothetical protein
MSFMKTPLVITLSLFIGFLSIIKSHASAALSTEKKSPAPAKTAPPPAKAAPPVTAAAAATPAAAATITIGSALVGISAKDLALALLNAPSTSQTIILKSGQHTFPKAATGSDKKSYFNAGTNFLAHIRTTVTSGTCTPKVPPNSMPKLIIECTHTFPPPAIGKRYKSHPGGYVDTSNMIVVFWVNSLAGKSYTNIESLNKSIAELRAGDVDGLTTFYPVV